MVLTPFLLSSSYFLSWFTDLSQWGNAVKVVGDIGIIDGTIVLGHSKRFVSQERLERKSIAAAVYEILACEGVPEQMQTGFLYAAPMIVFCHSRPQGIF